MIGMKFARGLLARFLLSLSKGQKWNCYRMVTRVTKQHTNMLPNGNSTGVAYPASRLIATTYKIVGHWHGMCSLYGRERCTGYIRVYPKTINWRF